MADATRIAEACLLLNYSCQSYQKQLEELGTTTKQANNQDVRLNNDFLSQGTSNTIIDRIAKDDQNLSPRKDDACVISCEAQSKHIEDVSGFQELSKNISTRKQDFESRLEANNRACYYTNSPNREPINDLLAAVNCALPSYRGRPNILHKPVQNLSSSNLICLPYPPDHDYCLQTSPSKEEPKTVKTNESGFSGEHSLKKSNDLQVMDGCTLHRKPIKLIAIHLGASKSSYSGDNSEILNFAKSLCEETMLKLSQNKLSQKNKKSRSISNNSTRTNIDNNCGQNISSYSSENITAEIAVVELIKRMENHQSLNCGFGSNLNIKGQVECDASLMSDKTGMWAGVGSVSGCRNPILLAKSLYDHRLIARPMNLVQPNLLVGSGAKLWMREHCPHLSIMDSKLISSKAFSTYQKLKSKYDEISRLDLEKQNQLLSILGDDDLLKKNQKFNRSNYINSTENDGNNLGQISDSVDDGFYSSTAARNLRKVASFAAPGCNVMNGANNILDSKIAASNTCNNDDKLHSYDIDDRLDTVGAVAIDSDDNFASAISSGGLLLKYKGRVGQAATPGAGCWSENSVAVTTTGVGEYLTVNLFARQFFEKIQRLRLLYDLGHVEKKIDQSNLIICAIDECFEDLISSNALSHVPQGERLAGILSICKLNSKDSPERTENDDIYLSYAHNTQSMCVGYMTCNDIVGHSVMSHKEDDSTTIKTLRFTSELLDKSNSL